MSKRLGPETKVIVTAGAHKGRPGTIQTRRSTLWVVAFSDPKGGSAQLGSTQLKPVTPATTQA